MSDHQAAVGLLQALGLKTRSTAPNQTAKRPATTLVLGTIPASYSGTGPPPVQFDWESSAGTRLYSYLSPYTPTAGDRVLVVLIGHGAVVLGKVLN